MSEKIALIYGVLMKQKEGFLHPPNCEYQRKELSTLRIRLINLY